MWWIDTLQQNSVLIALQENEFCRRTDDSSSAVHKCSSRACRAKTASCKTSSIRPVEDSATPDKKQTTCCALAMGIKVQGPHTGQPDERRGPLWLAEPNRFRRPYKLRK